jgi:5-methylcytosine-specific restriction endonuclease McrA
LKDIILSNLDTPKKLKNHQSLTVTIAGEEIYALSDRYKLFFTKGYTCVNCGITGKYFALEKDRLDKRYHLNLYAVDDNSKEVLMTKDHIIPKSRGGSNTLDNYQTMCCKCNKEKGNNIKD